MDTKHQAIMCKPVLIERIVRAVAGIFVLTSISMAYLVNINWLWLGIFVGVNLVQSAFTKFCPLEMILQKSGVK